jgi:signal recognition particle subunit SRP54
MLDTLTQRMQDLRQSLDWDLLDTDTLSERHIDDACATVRRALLEADANLRTVQTLLLRVKEQALGQKIFDSISPEQHFIALLQAELTRLLGNTHQQLNLEPTSTTPLPMVLLFGLQGSGKTTTCAKLANYLAKHPQTTALQQAFEDADTDLEALASGAADTPVASAKPLLVAADTFRPAAIDQLKQLGQRANIDVFTLDGETDMATIVKAAQAHAQDNGHTALIVDTAGRLQVSTELMADLLLLERTFAPQEKLLVIDALMGQEAVAVAEAFSHQVGLTGCILTKLDGDSRGGAMLSVVEATGTPIKWMGTGETLEALEPFHPKRMASRLLGMGDMMTLLERATSQQATSLEAVNPLTQGDLTYNDYLAMRQQLQAMGGLGQVLNLLPGMLGGGGGDKKVDKKAAAAQAEAEMRRGQRIIGSMTAAERANPDLMLEPTRQQRVAKGAGLPATDIKRFVESFEEMRQSTQQMKAMMDAFNAPPEAEEATADDDDSPIDWNALFGGLFDNLPTDDEGNVTLPQMASAQAKQKAKAAGLDALRNPAKANKKAKSDDDEQANWLKQMQKQMMPKPGKRR